MNSLAWFIGVCWVVMALAVGNNYKNCGTVPNQGQFADITVGAPVMVLTSVYLVFTGNSITDKGCER